MKIFKMAFVAILIVIINAKASETDSIIAEHVVTVYKQIKKNIINGNIDSLRSAFYSDTIVYFEQYPGDPDSVGKTTKYVWGNKDFNLNIISVFKKHWLTCVVPQNDTIVWAYSCLGSDSLINQQIEIRRNNRNNKMFETLGSKEYQCLQHAGYAIKVIFNRISKTHFKIKQINQEDWD